MSPTDHDAAEVAPLRGVLADVRASIVGEARDYTRGPIGRAILVLAIPMVLEMSMQSLFGVVDVFFVGRLGSGPVAIVGLCDSILALVFSVSIGLGMGTTAMVARRVGEGHPRQAAAAAVQAIAAGAAIAVPMGILGVVFASESLELMGATPELAAEGEVFTAIILGGNITVMMLFLINAVFRGAGDPAVAMRSLWLANLINIALDPILIFGWGPIPALGLEGAAIATTLSRALGVAYQLHQLSRPQRAVRLRWRDARIDLGVLTRLIRVSGIGVLQYLISTASFIGLVRIIAAFGDTALAGYTIAVRVIIFILLPAWGLGNAAATLVGQNLGAGKPDRAERSVWLSARVNTVFLAFVALLFLFGSRGLVGIFTDDPEVIAVAAQCLQIFAWSYVPWGFGVITVLAFNGAGDTTTPTWINFFIYWVVQIPLAYTLAEPLGLGPRGVFLAITACQFLLAIVGVTLFRRGSWKRREI